MTRFVIARARTPPPAPAFGSVTRPGTLFDASPVGRRIRGVELRVTYDSSADAAYIYLGRIEAGGVATTVAGEDEAGSVNLDFDHDGRLLGIEVLAASRWLPREVIVQAEHIG